MAHDAIEIYTGDVTVWESSDVLNKKTQDDALAAKRMLKEFSVFPWIARKYQEYEKRDTPEKCFVYALDKIYPHITILIADYHPIHPTWEAYKRTEEIAYQKISESFPALLPLFDDLCLMFRKKPHFFSSPISKNVQR